MASVAAKVAANKAAHPDRYCPSPRCLWRTDKRGGYSPCPKHQPNELPIKADRGPNGLADNWP